MISPARRGAGQGVMSGGTEMSEKLPVFATVGEAFHCLRKYNLRIMPYMAAVMAVFGVGWAAFSTIVLQGDTSRSTGSQSPLMAFFGFLLNVAFFVALLPVITSFQRLVLQGSGARVGFAYRREEWMEVRAVGRLIAVSFLGAFAIMVFLGLVGVLAPWVPPLVSPPLLFVCVIICVRWTLVMPAAAVGEHLTLGAAYGLVKGNFWRFLAVMLLLGLMITIPQMIVIRSVVSQILQLNMMFYMPLIPSPINAISLCFFLVFYYFGTLMSAATWALIYQNLSSGAAKAGASVHVEDGALPDPVI